MRHVEEYDDTLNVEENILKFCTIARLRAEIIEFCGFKRRVQFTARYLMPLIPASNEPSAVLARAFGECREGHIPRCSAALQA